MIDRAKATPTDRILVLKGKTWTANRRTDSAVDNQASAFKTFNAAALVAGEALGVIASVAAEDLADSAAAGSAVAGSEADDEN
jgi:hypothetical protein